MLAAGFGSHLKTCENDEGTPGMGMKNRKLLLIFAIFISFVFQIAAAHGYYDTLIEADFLGSGLKFEAADVETLVINKQTNPDLGPSTSSSLYLPETGVLELLTPDASTPSAFAIIRSILRC
jgi:hypothetical protein